jgi:hypothetical protein
MFAQHIILVGSSDSSARQHQSAIKMMMAMKQEANFDCWRKENHHRSLPTMIIIIELKLTNKKKQCITIALVYYAPLIYYAMIVCRCSTCCF